MTLAQLCLLVVVLSIVGALTGRSISPKLSTWLGFAGVVGVFASVFMHLPLLFIGSFLVTGFFTGAMVAGVKGQQGR